MTTDTASMPHPGRASSERETETERRTKTSIVLTSQLSGMLWFAGWLFTLGVAELHFWKGLLALILWPYFLGVLAR